MKPKLLIPFLLFFTLLACRPTPATPQSTIAPSPTLPISTPSMRPTATSIPPSLTMAPLPTATLRWTPLPTLSESESASYALDLMQTNGNCQLPCWWGITPGETSWDFAFQFLAPFVFRIDPIGSTTIMEEGIEKDLLVYSVPFIVQGELVIDGQPGIIFSTFYIQKGQVHTIETPSFGSQDKYLLPGISKFFGQPQEALIMISNPVVAPTRKISLVFLFPDNGVVVTYRKDVDVSTEPQINICFEQEPDLRLQSQNPERNIADFKQDRYIEYGLLEDVVGISLEALLDNIQESGEPCFEISNPNVLNQ